MQDWWTKDDYAKFKAATKLVIAENETRIAEFLTQNETKVVGLREGNWIRKIGNRITVEGNETTRIFENDKEPYEIMSGTEL